MKASVVRSAAVGCLAGLGSVTSGCGPSGGEPTSCATEDQPVLLNEDVQGVRVGDIVEPYAGTYSGTLSYSDGESTGLAISVPLNSDEACHLSNVWQCRAKEVYCYSTTHVTTEDGVFSHDVMATLHDYIPDAVAAVVYDSVLSYSALAPAEWGETLTARLPIDVSRYDSPSLHFELDWPAQESPRSGKLVFSGYVRDTDLLDEVVVASLEFETD